MRIINFAFENDAGEALSKRWPRAPRFKGRYWKAEYRSEIKTISSTAPLKLKCEINVPVINALCDPEANYQCLEKRPGPYRDINMMTKVSY